MKATVYEKLKWIKSELHGIAEEDLTKVERNIIRILNYEEYDS